MQNYMLPGVCEKFKLNSIFLKYHQQHKKYFYDNINFYCAYGSFPISIWDGGRVFSSYKQSTKEEIIYIRDFYESMGVKTRIVCTNPVLEEKHLTNTWMNLVCSLIEDEGEIVINSSLLENYVREKYPNLKIISSTTKCLKDAESATQELNKDYHMVCLDYNLNKNFDFLKTIENKDKTEFLVNAICPPNCPNRKNHYRLNGIALMNYGRTYGIKCGIQHNQLHPKTKNYSTFITPEEIQNTYEPMGFSNFKLEGRTFDDFSLLGVYIYYFVKPEYQLLAFSDIAKML